MRHLLALVLAVTACAAPGESSPDAAPPAQPAAPAEPAKPDEPGEQDDGGFADPKHTEQPAPAEPSKPDPELAARIKERFGDPCRFERSCGELVGVDCNSAVDGPYHYVQRADLKLVATCGGACMGGRCTDCPPKAWTCPTY